MNIEEYKKIRNELRDELNLKIEECNTKLHLIRLQYVEENKKFNIGDYLYNTCGMIKVDEINYKIFFDNIEITYSGYKYYKKKGVIFKTKYYNKTKTTMSESNNLQLLKM
jgi:hypothetical protein